MLDKVWNKIKETIGILKFDNANIFIDTDDKLLDVTLKTVVILLAFVVKNDAEVTLTACVKKEISMTF